MIAVGIVLNLAGLGVFCWLLFTLAVYALPSFAGVTAGLYANQTGAGPLGAVHRGPPCRRRDSRERADCLRSSSHAARSCRCRAVIRGNRPRLRGSLRHAVCRAHDAVGSVAECLWCRRHNRHRHDGLAKVVPMPLFGGGTSGPDRDADRHTV